MTVPHLHFHQWTLFETKNTRTPQTSAKAADSVKFLLGGKHSGEKLLVPDCKPDRITAKI